MAAWHSYEAWSFRAASEFDGILSESVPQNYFSLLDYHDPDLVAIPGPSRVTLPLISLTKEIP